MTDLTTWLLAQIAAEEERAWAATPGPWTLDCPDIVSSEDGWIVQAFSGETERNMPHIAANDPAATLRRCAAYRAIMDAAVKAFSYDATYDNIVCGEQNAYDVTLRALASIYADADGYDPSWRL